MTLTIVNLRDATQFLPVIADRIWHAFWSHDGHPRSAVVAALDEVVAAPDFPFTLVALVDGAFAGTVTAIDSDLDERPELGPWIAALWVEPAHRGAGIARALVDQANATMFAQGHAQIYLNAKPAMRPYYLATGWSLMEAESGTTGVDIFNRHAATGAGDEPA